MNSCENTDNIKLEKWVIDILVLDIAIYAALVLIFPDLWFNGITFFLVAAGTIVSYLVYEKVMNPQDTAWKKPAGILVTLDIGINAVFCIIISALIIIGVLVAARLV